VASEFTEIGTELAMEIRKKACPAKVVKNTILREVLQEGVRGIWAAK